MVVPTYVCNPHPLQSPIALGLENDAPNGHCLMKDLIIKDYGQQLLDIRKMM